MISFPSEYALGCKLYNHSGPEHQNDSAWLTVSLLIFLLQFANLRSHYSLCCSIMLKKKNLSQMTAFVR